MLPNLFFNCGVRPVSADPSIITDKGYSQLCTWITYQGHLENRRAWGRLYTIVYARHGRELMGFKSPVSVPM